MGRLYLPDLGAYLSFLALVVLVFGVTFEMPVVLCLLGAIGILSSRQLRNWRKPAYFVIILVALVVTPGADPFTPTFLSLALIFFYEGSILVIHGPLHHMMAPRLLRCSGRSTPPCQTLPRE